MVGENWLMLLQRTGRQKLCLCLKAHRKIPNSGRRTNLRIFAEYDQSLFFLLCFLKIIIMYLIFLPVVEVDIKVGSKYIHIAFLSSSNLGHFA